MICMKCRHIYDVNSDTTSARSVTKLNTINMRNYRLMINYSKHNISSGNSEEAPDSDVRMLDLRSRTNSQNMYLCMLDVVNVLPS